MNQSPKTPLLEYMERCDIRPYSRASVLLKKVNVAWTYLGDIATGKRRCEVDVLHRIEVATDGEVTVAAMVSHWYSDQAESSAA